MDIKVSVIIPVYNSEKYLTECIESLLSQTLEECEFIFINDGSNDNSQKIIEKYKKVDSRIILINQENHGVSIARNNGLDIATGEYVGFVDADDFIEKGMYKLLFDSAKQEDCDMIISNFESQMEGKKVYSEYPFPKNIILNKEYIQQQILPYFLRYDDLNTVCTKLFKKDVIRKFNVQFPHHVALGEDGMFSIQFFNNAEKIKFIEYTGYQYREVLGSATRNVANNDYFKRALEVYQLELVEKYLVKMDKRTIKTLKSIKLMNGVMAYLYIFLKPTNKISFLQRLKYIKNVIHHETVREALSFYIHEMYPKLGRYEKFLINMIKRKSIAGIYFATAYSRLRSK